MTKKIVMCFPEGRHKALTMSYDDGVGADRRLVRLFNQYGIRSTFHLNSGSIGVGQNIRKEELATLYEGHEVAAHTISHPTIARSPKEHLVEEIIGDRKALEALVGYPVRGFSYPNGSYNSYIKNLLPFLGIEYARVVPHTEQFHLPDDWYEWKPTCHHNHRLLELADEFISLNKRQHLYLMYVWGHSFEFDRDDNWELMEQFCRFIGGQDGIWYATNVEIVDYVKAFHRLQFSAACDFVCNPSACPVWISVDDSVHELKAGATTRL